MFDLADIWAARTGHRVRLVSANDHIHSRGSAHYAGLALDLQSSDPDALSAVFRFAGYRVLWKVPGHFGHVHVEHPSSGASPVLLFGQPLRQAMSARRLGDQRIGG
jgi:hypothetical protein